MTVLYSGGSTQIGDLGGCHSPNVHLWCDCRPVTRRIQSRPSCSQHSGAARGGVLPGASTRARTAAFESGAVVAASETPSMSAARPRARALRSGSPLGACGGRARARWRCACSVYVCEYKVACTKKKCLHFVLHRIRVTQLARAALRHSERARARKVNSPYSRPRRATQRAAICT